MRSLAPNTVLRGSVAAAAVLVKNCRRFVSMDCFLIFPLPVLRHVIPRVFRTRSGDSVKRKGHAIGNGQKTLLWLVHYRRQHRHLRYRRRYSVLQPAVLLRLFSKGVRMAARSDYSRLPVSGPSDYLGWTR